MSQRPLFEHRSRHGQRGTGKFRCPAAGWVGQQPRFEFVWRRILIDRTSEQLSFDREAECVGRLVALAFSPAAVRRFECGEQGAAHLPWAQWLRPLHGNRHTLLADFPLATLTAAVPSVTSSTYPGVARRGYPCSIAATSKSTLPRSSSITAPGAQPCSFVNTLT